MSENELKTQWIETIKRRGFYHLHSCSICGYRCGWLFDDAELVYDSGCECTGRYVLTPVSLKDLDFYLIPRHGHLDRIMAYIREGYE